MNHSDVFIRKLAVFSFWVLLATVAAFLLFPKGYISFSVFALPLFFSGVIFVSRLLITRAGQNNSIKFTNAFLLISGLRFVLYLIIVLAYAVIFPNRAVGFIISFFVYYVIYTFFEVFGWMKVFQPK